MPGRRATSPRQCAGDARRRRDPKPRLGRSRRCAARRRPLASRQDHPGVAGPPHPQRLEHGLPGVAGRSIFSYPPIPIWSCRIGQGDQRRRQAARRAGAAPGRSPMPSPPASPTSTSRARLRKGLGARPATLTHLPISWEDRWWTFRHPLDFLGSDGGGGVGGGPGISVGAALALKNSGRLPVAICGDGDYLMGVTAVWTAVHYKIPLLFVIANNRSFYNDELHQERVARMRARPVENKWIGQRMADPGNRSRRHGPRARRGRLRSGDRARPILSRRWKRRSPRSMPAESPSSMCSVEPGYTANMTAAMTRAKS